MKRVIVVILLLLTCGSVQAEEKSIFDTEYVKYPRAVYERYCGHHLTAGGHWDCMDALDRDGIPSMKCENPRYIWLKAPLIPYGLEPAPLHFDELVIDNGQIFRAFWFYRCDMGE